MYKRTALKKIGLVSLSGAVIPSTWTKPIINSIVLPVHAQTSVCSDSDVAGEWEFAFGDPADVLELLRFNPDGTGESIIDAQPITWTLQADTLIVNIPPIRENSARTYEGQFNAQCSEIIGVDTSNNDPFTARRF